VRTNRRNATSLSARDADPDVFGRPGPATRPGLRFALLRVVYTCASDTEMPSAFAFATKSFAEMLGGCERIQADLLTFAGAPLVCFLLFGIYVSYGCKAWVQPYLALEISNG
jgi:hypothetical protein